MKAPTDSESQGLVLDLDHDNYFRMHRAVWQMRLAPSAFMVYSRLKDAGNMNAVSDQRRNSRTQILADLNLNRKTFDDAVNALEEGGMVARKYGAGNVVQYLLLSPNAWKLPVGPENGPTANEGELVQKTGQQSAQKLDQQLVQKTGQPTSLRRKKEERTREGIVTQGCSAPPASPPPPPSQAELFDEQAESGNRLKRAEKPAEAPAPTLPTPEPETALVVLPSPLPKARKPKAEPTGGALVWNAYAAAYAGRYGTDPIRNAKQNALCSQLVQRLGEIAPAVVAFYVTHPNGFYAQNMHALGLCVKDAEPLAVQMQRGERMTQTKARQIDKHGAMGDVMQRTMERIKERAAERVARGEPE